MADPVLKPNQVGSINDPVNIAIMDVPAFIGRRQAKPVTSLLALEPSTNNYHPDGLYSELVFGMVGSPERMVQFGYVDLNTPIFHPKIFKIICQLGGLYKDIMSGAAYAIFDPVIKDFKRVVGDPYTQPSAGTGFTYFLNHFPEMSFQTTASSKRDERIEVIKQYQERLLLTRYLVEPAGLRDAVNDSSGRLVQDDINKIYSSLIAIARSIPNGNRSPLFDTARYQLQSKAQEIYEYLENFLDGKTGFVQAHFARRNVAGGTRNVITAATMIASSPEDPQLLKADDVMVGVYQTIKGCQLHANHAYFTIFGKTVFKSDNVEQVALSDPATGKLVYVTISPEERDKWTTIEGVDKLINQMRNLDLRKKPVMVKANDGKPYALMLVYDEGDTIALCRSITDLEQRWPRKVHKDRLRPMTYIEMFYLIAEVIATGKHGLVTRYPVIEQGSSYVAKLHVVSTTPSRMVNVVDLLLPGAPTYPMRQYPIIGSSYMDAMMVHGSKLSGLGGD